MPSTAEVGRDLLAALSDDELARYGEIARDQANGELSRWWLQAALAVGACAAVAGAAASSGILRASPEGAEAAGIGWPVVLELLAGLALGWSPARRLRNWTLWDAHCRSVRAEQGRRHCRTATGVRADVAR